MEEEPEVRTRVQWELGERRKELRAIQGAAQILAGGARAPEEVLPELLALLPPAWQFPEIAEARIFYSGLSCETPGFRTTPWMQRERFTTNRGSEGGLELAYVGTAPVADEGPFLVEERDLIRCLSAMLLGYLEHHEADAEVLRARDRLEEQVRERTARLRELTRELTLAEARQRRSIAQDLHDHLGQALAFLRMQLSELQGDSMFSGLESRLQSMAALLDKAIRYTRSLTSEISPPVLYELGFLPAVDWLAEQMETRHGLCVTLDAPPGLQVSEESLRVLLFVVLRELLFNVVKHAQSEEAHVKIERDSAKIAVSVRDEGVGFDPDAAPGGDSFGLFSIGERVRSLGGTMRVESSPGHGARVTCEVPLRGDRE